MDTNNSASTPNTENEKIKTIRWYQLNTKLFEQEFFVTPALLILLSTQMIKLSFKFYSTYYYFNLTYIWYVGAVAGYILNGMGKPFWPYRYSNIVCGILLLLAIIILIFTTNGLLIHIASFLSGFSYAFTYNVLITHISDNVSKKYRGFIVTNLSIIEVTAPIFNFMGSKLETLISFVLTLFAILIVRFMSTTHESVTISLRKDQVDNAKNEFKNLNKLVLSSDEIHDEIDEMTKMVKEDYYDEYCCFGACSEKLTHGNWKPLFLMSALRIVYVLGLFRMAEYVGDDINFYVCLLICRLVIMILMKFSFDKIGRRIPFILSATISVVAMGIILLLLYFSNSKLMKVFIFIYYVALSFGIEPLRHLYSSEAFPLSKRNGSLAFIGVIESIAWFNLISLTTKFAFYPYKSEYNYDYVIYILIVEFIIFVLLLVLLLWFLPETKDKSIRQSRADFNSFYRQNCIPIEI